MCPPCCCRPRAIQPATPPTASAMTATMIEIQIG
jgi:hypothetical protein